MCIAHRARTSHAAALEETRTKRGRGRLARSRRRRGGRRPAASRDRPIRLVQKRRSDGGGGAARGARLGPRGAGARSPRGRRRASPRAARVAAATRSSRREQERSPPSSTVDRQIYVRARAPAAKAAGPAAATATARAWSSGLTARAALRRGGRRARRLERVTAAAVAARRRRVPRRANRWTDGPKSPACSRRRQKTSSNLATHGPPGHPDPAPFTVVFGLPAPRPSQLSCRRRRSAAIGGGPHAAAAGDSHIGGRPRRARAPPPHGTEALATGDQTRALNALLCEALFGREQAGKRTRRRSSGGRGSQRRRGAPLRSSRRHSSLLTSATGATPQNQDADVQQGLPRGRARARPRRRRPRARATATRNMKASAPRRTKDEMRRRLGYEEETLAGEVRRSPRREGRRRRGPEERPRRAAAFAHFDKDGSGPSTSRSSAALCRWSSGDDGEGGHSETF